MFSGRVGELAQLGERLPCTQEVTGSNPVFSTSCSRWKQNGQHKFGRSASGSTTSRSVRLFDN